MSVLTLEGWFEGGRVRLREEAKLPDRTKVYVIVPGAEERVPRIRSPRLADPAQASEFEIEVTELSEDQSNAGL